jgi:hypothetical protein
MCLERRGSLHSRDPHLLNICCCYSLEATLGAWTVNSTDKEKQENPHLISPALSILRCME